jgi:UDP-N-acetylmuramoyl-tripeptide--D-alanyl-D-alanine ligase
MKRDVSFFRQALPSCRLYVSDTGSFYDISAPSLDGAFSLFDGTRCSVSIDSKKIKRGQAFVALKGKRSDAHDFLKEALENGASILVINESEVERLKEFTDSEYDFISIIVPDTFKALISLAKTWRSYFDIPIVGITGSIGKTTTKEMLRSIFDEAKVSACVSFKNQNTNIGICLNIFNLRKEHKVAVFELGINKKNEMAELADILLPTMALITGVAHVHTKGLGNIEGIAKEKKLIFKNFKNNNIGFVCGDNSQLSDSSYHHPVVKFGLRIKNHVQARKVKLIENDSISFTLKMYGKKELVVLKTNHVGMVNNALAASSIAYFLQIPFADIVKGLQQFDGFENRFEKRNLKRNQGVLISDCYNASPESMRAAIISFNGMQSSGKKIVVLGDMLELGDKEIFWHRQIGRVLGKTDSFNSIVLVGERAKSIAKTAPVNMNVSCVENWQDAERVVSELLFKSEANSLILVKASRAMQLDKMVEKLIE